MDMMIHTIGLALMMVMVIEGLLYALFPAQMKRMMISFLAMPNDRIRSFALGIAGIGAIGVWYYLST